jgi:peptidyl-prolyl cis-trans isomerase D
MTPSEFEEGVRRSLATDKLRMALTEWLSVPDEELEQEYHRRNDKVKLAVISVTLDSVRSQVAATDPEVAGYFESHQIEFRIPEKRRVRYLLIDINQLRAKITVAPSDVERAYNDNIDQYTTPEQLRASHILFVTEGKDDAAIKAKAEEVLKQAKSGTDFAELARTYSKDEASAKQGGDLDYFGRGRMVPEFEQVAFAMQPGEISDLVKSEYGYHIIKLVDRKAGAVRDIEDVRQQIIDQLASTRAQVQAEDLARTLEKQISKPADLDKAAAAHGLQVQESELFARDEPISGLGLSLEAGARAFELKPGEVTGPVRASRGFAFETLVATQDPYVPKLDEVKDRVRAQVITQKTLDVAKQKAAALAARLTGASDFEKAAKSAGVEAKTTELIARGSPISDLGTAPAVEDAAFSLPVGAVSGPIATENGTAVIKVIERKDVTPEEWTSARDSFRNELLTDRRNRFFSAYMVKAKQRMKIEINRDALQRVVS